MRSGRIVMNAYGPPAVLSWEEAELEALAPDEVRIRTLAAAVNHSDLEIRAGNWPVLRRPPFPYVPGLEVVGELVDRGAEVTDVAPGDRVITMMQGLGGVRAERPGGYAEHVTVRAGSVAVVPAAIDAVQLAAIGLAGVTAYEGLALLGSVEGRTIVISGAGGGVGSAAVALARRAGARVRAIASRAEQKDYLLELGADEIIVARTTRDLAAHLAEWSTELVLDTVAGPLFPVLVKALQPRGRLCLVGAVAGASVGFDAYDLLHGITLTGYSSEALDGRALRAAIAALTGALENKELAVPETTVLPLREARRAHELLERHEVTGRVVLVPGA